MTVVEQEARHSAREFFRRHMYGGGKIDVVEYEREYDELTNPMKLESLRTFVDELQHEEKRAQVHNKRLHLQLDYLRPYLEKGMNTGESVAAFRAADPDGFAKAEAALRELADPLKADV